MTHELLKTELIDRIHEDMDWLTRKEVTAALDAMLDRIVEGVADGQRVKMEHFGTFEPEWVPPTERWHARKLRKETYPGFVAVRFFQAYWWTQHPGFEHLTPFEKRLRDKRWRQTQAHFAAQKKKPR